MTDVCRSGEPVRQQEVDGGEQDEIVRADMRADQHQRQNQRGVPDFD